jgi:hypothetical protein
MNCVSYRLPTSFVVVTGTVVRTIDELDDLHHDDWSAHDLSLKEYSVSVVTEGDGPTYFVSPTRGNWMWSYKGTFATTVDGRLTGASGDSTGNLGIVVRSVVGVAGAVLGLRALAREGPEGPQEEIELEAAFGASRRELERYAQENPVDYEHARHLAAVIGTLRQNLVDAIQNEFNDGSESNRSTRLSALEPLTEAALARAKAHYIAWRASKRSTLEDTFEIRQRVDDVPTHLPDPDSDPAYIPPPAAISPTGDTFSQLPTDLADLWMHFGVGVTAIRPDRNRRTDAEQGKWKPVRGSEEEYVLVRQPELLELVVTRRFHVPNSDRCHRSVVSRSRHWVADTNSAHRWFKLQKSIWGRRSLKLEFDADGYLRGVSTNGDASLPTYLSALADAPRAVTGGLESVTKVGSSLSTTDR